MLFDYHVHTRFSPDSDETVENYVKAAAEKGVGEICFTNHLDLDYPSELVFEYDMDQCHDDVFSKTYPGIKLLCGVEFGLRKDEDIMRRQKAMCANRPLDFVIASVHEVDGMDPWFPSYFDGKTRERGFARYLETIYERLLDFYDFDAVGHIDYPTKGCPYSDNILHISDAPDVLDALFRFVVERGKCIELNTSVFKKLDGGVTDINVLKRYVELGGEYITIGSDAHDASGLAYRFEDGLELAKSAGIKYLAAFEGRKPRFMRL